LSSGKKRVKTYPSNSAALKMDGDRARTDAPEVGGHAVCAEARMWICVERMAEQILAVVADTRMKRRAPKEKGFCGRDNRAELVGSKRSGS